MQRASRPQPVPAADCACSGGRASPVVVRSDQSSSHFHLPFLNRGFTQPSGIGGRTAGAVAGGVVGAGAGAAVGGVGSGAGSGAGAAVGPESQQAPSRTAAEQPWAPVQVSQPAPLIRELVRPRALDRRRRAPARRAGLLPGPARPRRRTSGERCRPPVQSQRRSAPVRGRSARWWFRGVHDDVVVDDLDLRRARRLRGGARRTGHLRPRRWRRMPPRWSWWQRLCT